jgi:pimeloyl-ACP methyl ester carboxylesterase
LATFVLIHGGFAGAWQWQEVAERLRQAGQEAYTPTLTGMGELCHLASPEVDLNTHIQDIVDLFESQRIENAILVGFSYSGMVITGVAEHIPEKIARLVYLDAFVPQDGQSFADVIGPVITDVFQERANAGGQGWLVPPEEPGEQRLASQPLKTALTVLHLENPQAVRIPRTFIYCTGDKNPLPLVWEPLARAAAQARSSPEWTYFEIPTGHMAMLSMPDKVAHILLYKLQ